MRIQKMRLEGFRAFDDPFDLDLEGGKNLLLYGENGSGKSSIYLALRRFFEECCDDISNHRNHFSKTDRESGVSICFDNAGVEDNPTCKWCSENGHPLSIPEAPDDCSISPELRSILVDGARRSGFLDYRAMLRTSLLSSPLPRSNKGPAIHNAIYGAEMAGLEKQLFDLVTLSVLAGVPVTVSGGSEETIGKLIRAVFENRPNSRRPHDLVAANSHANRFNQAFNSILPDLQASLTNFLGYFESSCLEIDFHPVSLAWDKTLPSLVGAELVPEIRFRGQPLDDYHLCLNEARLSALALCLFLAGVVLSDNDYDNPDHPRILVLDDAVIGLDLQNRLPLLRILSSDVFKNYQILLLTYDRVWFDLARGHLQDKKRWIHKELVVDEGAGYLVPHLKPSGSDLDRAREHLTSGDLKAAAVYARSAFENKLRNVCESKGIKLKFKKETRLIGAGMLWDGIVSRQREREQKRKSGAEVANFVPNELEIAVETMRSTVLNQLSHTGTCNLVGAEVKAAIATIQQVIDHDFPRAK